MANLTKAQQALIGRQDSQTSANYSESKSHRAIAKAATEIQRLAKQAKSGDVYGADLEMRLNGIISLAETIKKETILHYQSGAEG